MAGKSARKSQRRRGQSLDIKTGQASTSEIPIPLLVSLAVRIIAIINLHCLFEIGTLSQNWY